MKLRRIKEGIQDSLESRQIQNGDELNVRISYQFNIIDTRTNITGQENNALL